MVVPDETRGDTAPFNRLAYLGLLPFVFGIGITATGYSLFGVDGRLWFTAYSSIILSFLCGVWWAGALNQAGHESRAPLMFLSNGIALIGWGALLIYQTPVALPLLALAFLFVERAEARLKPNASCLSKYFQTRSRVTYLVIVCHLVMIVLLWR